MMADPLYIDQTARVGPRILHLIPADGIGGVETAAKSMLYRNDLPCRFSLQFIETAAPSGRTPTAAWQMLRAHRGALKSAMDFGPDVILCSLWRSVPVGLMLRAGLPTAKLVYFIHSDADAHRLDRLLSMIAMKRADAVWGDSAAALTARGAPSDKVRIISFVTDRVAITDKAFTGARFVSWGRLHRFKGYDRAVRFIKALRAKGIDATYDIYGPDNGEGGALQAQITSFGLDAFVKLKGTVARRDLRAIADRYAFFLQPSRLEGMCMAAVEAMQYGLVPVTTPVGEMACYVVPDSTGVLIDPDRMTSSIEAVAALLATPSRWHRLSLASMRRWHDAPLYAEDVCRAATDLVAWS